MHKVGSDAGFLLVSINLGVLPGVVRHLDVGLTEEDQLQARLGLLAVLLPHREAVWCYPVDCAALTQHLFGLLVLDFSSQQLSGRLQPVHRLDSGHYGHGHSVPNQLSHVASRLVRVRKHQAFAVVNSRLNGVLKNLLTETELLGAVRQSHHGTLSDFAGHTILQPLRSQYGLAQRHLLVKLASLFVSNLLDHRLRPVDSVLVEYLVNLVGHNLVDILHGIRRQQVNRTATDGITEHRAEVLNPRA
ncbi:integral membrane protein [Klebsiella phage KN3-1]|uniref:Integral membrane protein n=1 Tax=Klebsiella phage KN3-1 TaxID=2282630 RepID=A0A3T0ZBW0_BPK31|nr:integral membrane protein [Klebsiella phage KN3-1]BBF66849.1 integral membrane protein [Klebsiella phage KN3-1]